ncbi:UDP-glucosyltransferase 2 [Periplaneta americana]|uniref:UDP-glucosyltransferase 2 n=1 Tax=Periplaneta americana TaxID=6978 RepID=UPI0037E78CC8
MHWAAAALTLWGVSVAGSRVLMATMGGTKSHTIPFMELAKGLIARGHNVTFLHAFPPETETPGLEELTPLKLVFYVRNYTNWDLLGARMEGREPVPLSDIMRYGYYSCEAMMSDPETQRLLHSGRSFDLAILDGAYPECIVGLAHYFRVPFMFINTVAFYMTSVAYTGSPSPYSVTPFMARGFTDDMGFLQRVSNSLFHSLISVMHTIFVKLAIQGITRRYVDPALPPIIDIVQNVSFVLQNGHATLTYPRPYLPNVAEVACIHCKPARPLPPDLEDFVSGGDAGFVYVSMGSSVLTVKMPEVLRLLFLRAFAQLPYRVLWKWEGGEGSIPDLPPNVRLGRWLPQQDILGHRKIRAFVTHGGLLSMFETVYHGVPVVTMPVFCDHDANAAKAELDGYALRLELQDLTAERLRWAIEKVATNPKYRQSVNRRSMLLRDQEEHPLQRAIYWTEYVLRHEGAYHLQSPSRRLGIVQYYLLDVVFFCLLTGYVAIKVFLRLKGLVFRFMLRLMSNTQTATEEDDELAEMKRKVKGAVNGVSSHLKLLEGQAKTIKVH